MRSLALFYLLCLASLTAYEGSEAYTLRKNILPELPIVDDEFNGILVTKPTSNGPVVIHLATLGVLAGVHQYDTVTGKASDCFKEQAKCDQVQVLSLSGTQLPDVPIYLNKNQFRISTFEETSFFNKNEPPTFSKTKISHDKMLYDNEESAFETKDGVKYWRLFDNFLRKDIYMQYRDVKYFLKYRGCEFWSDEDDDSAQQSPVIVENLVNVDGIVLRERRTRMPLATCVKDNMISIHALRASSMQARVAGFSFGYLDSFFELQPKFLSSIRVLKDSTLMISIEPMTCALTYTYSICKAVHKHLHRCGDIFVTTRAGLISLAYTNSTAADAKDSLRSSADFIHCHKNYGSTVFGKHMDSVLDGKECFSFLVGGGIEVVSM